MLELWISAFASDFASWSHDEIFIQSPLKSLREMPDVKVEADDLLKYIVNDFCLTVKNMRKLILRPALFVVLTKNRAPIHLPYLTLPPFLFVWDKQIRPADFKEESLEEGPYGLSWNFL